MWKLKVYDNEEIMLTAGSIHFIVLDTIVRKLYGMSLRQTAEWSDDTTYKFDNGAPIAERIFATISIAPEFWD